MKDTPQVINIAFWFIRKTKTVVKTCLLTISVKHTLHVHTKGTLKCSYRKGCDKE